MKGLYDKYTIINNETGEETKNCFVLRPGDDSAARYAIFEYIRKTSNKKLAVDLFHWIENLTDEQEVSEKGFKDE